jgi:hypothetical protein
MYVFTLRVQDYDKIDRVTKKVPPGKVLEGAWMSTHYIGSRVPYKPVKLLAATANESHIFTLNEEWILEIWDYISKTFIRRIIILQKFDNSTARPTTSSSGLPTKARDLYPTYLFATKTTLLINTTSVDGCVVILNTRSFTVSNRIHLSPYEI